MGAIAPIPLSFAVRGALVDASARLPGTEGIADWLAEPLAMLSVGVLAGIVSRGRAGAAGLALGLFVALGVIWVLSIGASFPVAQVYPASFGGYLLARSAWAALTRKSAVSLANLAGVPSLLSLPLWSS